MDLKIRFCCGILAAALSAAPAFAQTARAETGAADSMKVLRDQFKGDKKALVAANMDLSEAEAKKFWPLYEKYQKDLGRINDTLTAVIVAYAKEYNADSFTDAKATKLLEQGIAAEEAEVQMKRAFATSLAKVLPGRKVARYLQIENKMRAIVKYELASQVPLAP